MCAVVNKCAEPGIHAVRVLEDSRWDDFVRKCPHSSVFHSRGWLEALYRTYQYEPIVLTTSPDDSPIENGVLFCRIHSRLTGSRLVSLPFSDHCEPLVTSGDSLCSYIEQEVTGERLRYVEIRPKCLPQFQSSVPRSEHSYCLHELDLEPSLSTLFNNCHKDSTQRKIRRADREGLRYEEGRSEFHLEAFYRLLLLTRKRHGVPPQPQCWFKNLADTMGSALKIRLALKNEVPVAAILTLQHKETLVYKYACSDFRFHPLGPMHFLIWRAIEDGKQHGLKAVDFGRCSWRNQGLITFKDRWGSTRTSITYSRYSKTKNHFEYWPDESSFKEGAVKRVFRCLPDTIFQAIGEAFYKSAG